MTYLNTDRLYKHLGGFGGNVWYVSTTGNDSNTGKTPDAPFATILNAISTSAVGDAISVKAGTYDEIAMNLSKQALELWCEIGTIFNDTNGGTVLTVSADYCKVLGEFKITPTTAIGVLLSGDFCFMDCGLVLTGTTGVSITGAGNVLRHCRAGLQTVKSFSIAGDKNRLEECDTTGNAAATIGYHVNSGADNARILNCTSTGHATAGFQIDSGSEFCLMSKCSSGAGDGGRVDNGSNNNWNNFSFDDVKHKNLTLNANNTTVSTNLFEVTGIVKIQYLYGYINTVLSSNITAAYWDLYDGSTAVELTDNAGTVLSAAPVGSLILKESAATDPLVYYASTTPYLSESSGYKDPRTEFIVGSSAATTYIRFTYTTTDTPASGVIHFHVKWSDLSDNSYVTVV
jgi:hypothetical protein